MAGKLKQEQREALFHKDAENQFEKKDKDTSFFLEEEENEEDLARPEDVGYGEEKPKNRLEEDQNGGDYQTIVDFNMNESEWGKDRESGGYMDHVMQSVDEYRAAMTGKTWLPEQGLKLDRASIRSLAQNQAATVVKACRDYENNVKPWTPRGHQKMAAVHALHRAVEQQTHLMADDLSEYILSDEAIIFGEASYEKMVLAVQAGDIRSTSREEAVRFVEEESTDMSSDDDGRRKRTGRQMTQGALQSTDEEMKDNTQERKTKGENVKKDQLRFSEIASSLGKEGAGLLPFNPRSSDMNDGLYAREGISEFSEYSQMMGENKGGFEIRMSGKALNQINTIRMLGMIAGVEDYKNLAKNENLLFKYHKRGRRVAVESVVLKDPPMASSAYSGYLSKPEFESFVDDLRINQAVGQNLLDILRQLDHGLSSDQHAMDPNVRKKVQRLFVILTLWLRSGCNADAVPDRFFT